MKGIVRVADPAWSFAGLIVPRAALAITLPSPRSLEAAPPSAIATAAATIVKVATRSAFLTISPFRGLPSGDQAARFKVAAERGVNPIVDIRCAITRGLHECGRGPASFASCG